MYTCTHLHVYVLKYKFVCAFTFVQLLGMCICAYAFIHVYNRYVHKHILLSKKGQGPYL